ncbi:CidA/LrgA family protein [Acinetobacter sp. MD2(2019)]|uniref:CidA/LrgA family protein n=1 Tax=Acinetobacter sp. MD2(2019) TaxID=2605273 RepID=UPI002D1F2EE2|nr:CidA/LrgA family protein [Acinetobacter sp. MD2(2019)]MEB3755133.1 CidA/LrgA family protein [Acinetobacter sp. MD2(2019)]
MNTPFNLRSSMHELFEVSKQLLILSFFWLIGDGLNKLLHIPISAGILGMLILLLCLFCKIVDIDQVSMGAAAVLGELLLFFLPVVVAVVQYKTLFLTEGWQIMLCIVVGTVSVMLSTSLTIHYYHLIQRYFQWRKHMQHTHEL